MLKEYIENGILCPTACYDTALTLAFQSGKVTATIQATNRCGSDTPTRQTAIEKYNRGCSSGQTPPAISVTLTGSALSTKQPKNRCDVQTIQQVSAGNPTVSKTFPLQTQLITALQKVNTHTPEGREQLSQILVNLGVSKSDADARVADADKATDTQKQLQALVGGDEAASEEAAQRLGLKLNDSLGIQARLDPDKFKPVLSDSEYQATKVFAQSVTGFGPSSFISELEKARCAISTIESGSCGGNYSAIGPPTRNGGRAYGRYQVMDFNIRPWTLRACGRAHTPHEFLNRPECQDRVFDDQFGRVLQQCGFAGAAAKWFSGKCTIGVGGDGYTSIGTYVSKALAVFNGDSFPFGSRNSIYTGGGSPFGGVNPFGPNQYEGRVGCASSGYCYLASSPPAPIASAGAPAPVGQPVQSQTQAPVSSILPGTQGTIPTSQTLPVLQPPPPVATLLVQPTTTAVNKPVTVAWSSVGMRLDAVCRLLDVSSTTPVLVAEGNEGTQVLTPRVSGAIVFQLRCAPLTGGTLTKSATTTVQ